MAVIKLDVAFSDYDRTRSLVDGTVKFTDSEATFHSAPIVTQIFEGMVHGKYHVAELGLTYFCAPSRMEIRPSLRFRCPQPRIPSLRYICQSSERYRKAGRPQRQNHR